MHNILQNTKLPQPPTQPDKQSPKIRTWPLMLIALAGLTAVISLVLLIPQYLKAPLTELQSNVIQNSFDTPPSAPITPPPPQSASSGAQPPGVLQDEAKTTSSTPLYKVTRVVDGDTIVVNINGQDEKIRLIGVNTPESVDPRKPVECFGLEASTYTKSLLENQNVILESDPTQGDKDKYGRLLRYIHLPSSTTPQPQNAVPSPPPAAPTNPSSNATPPGISPPTNINLKLIQDGYAYEYTYRLPYKYQNEFKQAQIDAENSQKGLWAATGCR